MLSSLSSYLLQALLSLVLCTKPLVVTPHIASTRQLALELVSTSVKMDTTSGPGPSDAPQSYDEPIVARKELWSYYCMYYSTPLGHHRLTARHKYITMGVTCVGSSLAVWMFV